MADYIVLFLIFSYCGLVLYWKHKGALGGCSGCKSSKGCSGRCSSCPGHCSAYASAKRKEPVK